MPSDNEQGSDAPHFQKTHTKQNDHPGEQSRNNVEIWILDLYCVLDIGGPSTSPQEVDQRTDILWSHRRSVGESGAEPVPHS